jgi:hypothetical protein
MRKISSFLLVIFLTATFGAIHSLADDVSFHRIEVPDQNGKQSPAVLTFSDTDKAIEVTPVKRGDAVKIPYSVIDKCSYEFTKKHRINGGTIATSAVGVGAVMMFTKSKSHWLEIDYRDQAVAKVFVLRMDKHEYIAILDALKAHTGIDAEVLGNAQKR